VIRRIVLAAVIVLIVACVAGFLSAGRACAHDPRFACSPRHASNPVEIADPQKSWAFYGHLVPGETDYYIFTTREPLRVPWSILLDERDESNPARPVVTLYTADGKVRDRLDLKDPTRYYETFSQEQYLTSRDRSIAQSPGTYSAVVTMSGGRMPQRYTFAIGEAERFGLIEIPYVAGAVLRVRSLRY
jgi:hypothetical protein